MPDVSTSPPSTSIFSCICYPYLSGQLKTFLSFGEVRGYVLPRYTKESLGSFPFQGLQAAGTPASALETQPKGRRAWRLSTSSTCCDQRRKESREGPLGLGALGSRIPLSQGSEDRWETPVLPPTQDAEGVKPNHCAPPCLAPRGLASSSSSHDPRADLLPWQAPRWITADLF